MDTEKYLKNKHNISDEETDAYMQLLIDNGAIDPPFVVINENSEINSKTLTYKEYKKYMNNLELDSIKQLRIKYK